MKLLSMTDFVIENENMVKQTESEMSKDLFKLAQYAHFLKQPLELWMFVPCDEDGNVLKETTLNDEFRYFNNVEYYPHQKEEYNIKYQEAKQRCLFDGFECEEIYEWGFRLKISFDDFEEYIDLIKEDTIEDLLTYLVNFDWQLTQTAIKQLGL